MKSRKAGRIVRLRVCRADAKAWEAGARANGLTLSEYIRRKLNNKPVKLQKRRCAAEEAKDRERAEAEERERLERIAASEAMIARQKRMDEAERLAKAGGGVALWFARMSSEEREKWADLEGALLKRECLTKESELSWAQFVNPGAASLPPGAAPHRDRQIDESREAMDRAVQELFEQTGILL